MLRMIPMPMWLLWVRAAIVDPAGKTVATAVSDTATVAAREGTTFSMHTTVWHPQLWSLESPNLYKAVTTLEVDVADQDSPTFGDSWRCGSMPTRVSTTGKAVKIKGTCNHRNHAGVGRGDSGLDSEMAGAAEVDWVEWMAHRITRQRRSFWTRT